MSRSIAVSIALVLVTAVACRDGTGVIRSIEGRVELRSELGDDAGMAAGATVALSSERRMLEVMTDEQGGFRFADLGDAVFDLTISLDGYGTLRAFDLPPATAPLSFVLSEISSADITSTDAAVVACGSVLCLNLEFSVDHFVVAGANRRLFRLFLSDDPAVSAGDYDQTALLVVSNDDPGLTLQGDAASVSLMNLGGLDLDAYGPGTTVFVRLHGATENLDNSYVDPETGVEVFTDLSERFASASAILP